MKNRIGNWVLIVAIAGTVGLSGCCCNSSCTTPEKDGASADSTKNAVALAGPAEPAPAEASANAEETMTGTFKEIEWGDYPHFILTDATGEDVSFWLAPDLPDDQYDSFESGKKKGTKIQIKWRKATRDIPESGGMMELEEVFAISEL